MTPHRLRQVVDNLLVNALRHSPEGAAVEVRVESVGPDVVVEVADRGPGVPAGRGATDLRAVLPPDDFARARTTGGAGLGLAIVAAIAKAHGGAVGVRPNEGGGARFWVRIPAHPATAGVPTGPAPGPADGTRTGSGTGGGPGA